MICFLVCNISPLVCFSFTADGKAKREAPKAGNSGSAKQKGAQGERQGRWRGNDNGRRW